MITPDDHQTIGAVTKPYCTYNEFSANLLAKPIYYTDVCLASPTDKIFNRSLKKSPFLRGGENSGLALPPLSVANKAMCLNNLQDGENSSIVQNQISPKQPPDKDVEEICISQEKSNTSCDIKNSSSISVVATETSNTATTSTNTCAKLVEDNLNTFLSAESNFRKYQFQEKPPNFIDSANIPNQNVMGNTVCEAKSIASDSEAEQLIRHDSVIDLTEISDQEHSQSNNPLNLSNEIQDSSSSDSLDIKIVKEPRASERLMPQLSPLGSDASIVESAKDIPKVIEVIDLPSSPEMPTLLPETEEPIKEPSSYVSGIESNSLHVEDNESVMLFNQPKVILERITENCFPAQKCLKPSMVEKPGDSSLVQNHKGTEIVYKIPEIDVIDGLNFFSFASKPEMEKYCEENNCIFPFSVNENKYTIKKEIEEDSFNFKENVNEDTFHEENDVGNDKFEVEKNADDGKWISDQLGIITPKKTTNLTQIKGWKNKYFSPQSELPPVFESNSQGLVLHEIKNDSVVLKEPKNILNSTPLVNSDYKELPIVLSAPDNKCNMAEEKPFKKSPDGIKGIFVSEVLENFLENRAVLNDNFLRKRNPNITPIPPDNPILSLGKLRKTDDSFDNRAPLISVMKRKKFLISRSEPEQEEASQCLETDNSKYKVKMTASSRILLNEKNALNYSVSSVKRKYDGLSAKYRTKLNNNKTKAGIGRLVLRRKKENSGLPSEYEVASVVKEQAESSQNIHQEENEYVSCDGNPDLIIETLFSSAENKEIAALTDFLKNLNHCGTRKDLVNMLTTSTGSLFSNTEVLGKNLFTNGSTSEPAVSKNPTFQLDIIDLSPAQVLTKKNPISEAIKTEQKSTSNYVEQLECANDTDDRADTLNSGKLYQKGNNIHLRNKRSTRMPQRLLDSAILVTPGSEWVSPTLTEENQNMIRSSSKRQLAEFKTSQEIESNTSKMKKNDSFDRLAPAIDKSTDFAVCNKISTPQKKKRKKNIRKITKNPFCICQNVTRAMAFSFDLERLVCHCLSATLANYDSSVVDVTAVQVSRNEVESINNTTTIHGLPEDIVVVHDPANSVKKVSKTSENCKELGLHNYAASPILEGAKSRNKTAINSHTLNVQDPLMECQDVPVDLKISNFQDMGTGVYRINNVLEEIEDNTSSNHKTPTNNSLMVMNTLESKYKQYDSITPAKINETAMLNHALATKLSSSPHFPPLKSLASNNILSTSYTEPQPNSSEMCIDKMCSDSWPLEDLPTSTATKTLNNSAKYPTLPKNLTGFTIKENPYSNHSQITNAKETCDSSEVNGISETASVATSHTKGVLSSNTNIYCALASQSNANSLLRPTQPKMPVNLDSTPTTFLVQPPNKNLLKKQHVQKFKEQLLKMNLVFRKPVKIQPQLLYNKNSTKTNLLKFYDTKINSIQNLVYSEQNHQAAQLDQKDSEDSIRRLPMTNANKLVIDVSNSGSDVDIETVDNDYSVCEKQSKTETSDLSSLSSSSSSSDNDDNSDKSYNSNIVKKLSLPTLPRYNTLTKSYKEKVRRQRIKACAMDLKKTLNIGSNSADVPMQDLLVKAKRIVIQMRKKNRMLNMQEYWLLYKRQQLQASYKELVMELPVEQRKKHAAETLHLIRSAVCNYGSREFPVPPSLIEMNPYLRHFKKQPSAGLSVSNMSNTEMASVKRKPEFVDLVDSEEEKGTGTSVDAESAGPDLSAIINCQHDDMQTKTGLPTHEENLGIENKVTQYNIKFSTLPGPAIVVQNNSNFQSSTEPNSLPSSSVLSSDINPPLNKEVLYGPPNHAQSANWTKFHIREPLNRAQIIEDSFKYKLNPTNNYKRMRIPVEQEQLPRLMPLGSSSSSSSSPSTAGHKQIQSVFSAIRQISRPIPLTKQTSNNNNANIDNHPSLWGTSDNFILPDTIPLQNDVMDIGQVVDVTDATYDTESAICGAVQCDVTPSKINEALSGNVAILPDDKKSPDVKLEDVTTLNCSNKTEPGS